MLKNEVPMKMLEYEREGIKYWRKLHHREIHSLHILSYIIKIMKSKRITRLGHVTRLIEHANTFENEYPRERGLLLEVHMEGWYVGDSISKLQIQVAS
jgi:hypothetical protein